MIDFYYYLSFTHLLLILIFSAGHEHGDDHGHSHDGRNSAVTISPEILKKWQQLADAETNNHHEHNH